MCGHRPVSWSLTYTINISTKSASYYSHFISSLPYWEHFVEYIRGGQNIVGHWPYVIFAVGHGYIDVFVWYQDHKLVRVSTCFILYIQVDTCAIATPQFYLTFRVMFFFSFHPHTYTHSLWSLYLQTWPKDNSQYVKNF